MSMDLLVSCQLDGISTTAVLGGVSASAVLGGSGISASAMLGDGRLMLLAPMNGALMCHVSCGVKKPFW